MCIRDRTRTLGGTRRPRLSPQPSLHPQACTPDFHSTVLHKLSLARSLALSLARSPPCAAAL
eukprot:2111368-Rhodomonas_salina.1